MSDASKRLILLPVDSSEDAERAFGWYVENLRKPGDRLGIVHIHETPRLPSTFSLIGPMALPDDWADEVQGSVEKSQAVVSKFEGLAKGLGIETQSYLKASERGAGQGICALAEELNPSVVIMGSRGLNTVRRTLLGSVSSYVVNHCRTAVTVTPPVHHPLDGPTGADAVPHHWSA